MAMASRDDRYRGLITAFQACVQASQSFVGYSQKLVAGGDLSLVTSLRTAIDTDAVCGLVLNLAGLKSRFTPALARQAVMVLETALDATLAHAATHPDCRQFRVACQQALVVAKGVS